MTHEEKMAMRDHMHKMGMVLLDKVQRMVDSGELTTQQMMFAADILKDVASSEKSLAKAHWCESDSGTGKTY